jgi:AAA family ATP:ADP antiporter
MGHQDLMGESVNESYARLKFFFLSVAFFFVIGGYTIAKELKDSVFVSVVGRTYVPTAKILGMFVLIPVILFHAVLVDKIRRYQLLAFYSAFFGFFGLVFAWILGHPTIGLANTDSNSHRIFGWIFYFFCEGYSPFVVSVFWAFANSVTTPKDAKDNYAYMVSASKLGGMLSAAIAWYVFSFNASCEKGSMFDVFSHQIILATSSAMLLMVPVVIYFLMKKVPGKYLHGYEAVYQAEKKQQSKKDEGEVSISGMFSGLVLLLKYPYVLGIFGMVFFYEVIATILSYLRLGVAESYSMNISQVSAILFKMMFIMHLVGFVMSLIGTSTLLKRLGERTCLLLVPLLSGALLCYLMIETTPMAITAAFILFKAVNYAFAWPIRESLYIPTTKEIKFKAKSWVDAFGSKFAKASGSTFNSFVASLGSTVMLPIHSFLFAGIVTLWFLLAFFLGARFDRAVSRNEVIGLGKEKSA